MNVALGNFCLKFGCLGLGDFHAVQRANHLDFPFWRFKKDIRHKQNQVTPMEREEVKQFGAGEGRPVDMEVVTPQTADAQAE